MSNNTDILKDPSPMMQSEPVMRVSPATAAGALYSIIRLVMPPSLFGRAFAEWTMYSVIDVPTDNEFVLSRALMKRRKKSIRDI